MRRHLTRLAGIVVAGSLLLSIAGPATAADTAMVRVLHASPDAPAVDVYLDDTAVSALTNVPFGVISGYLAVPAGAHNVKVYATGTTTDPVIDADVTVAAGKKYTIAATGPIASIAAQVLQDAPEPSCATAQVRVVHFSADAPAVDVATSGAAPADAVVKALAYPNASGYLALPGGTYDLDVRLAGTTTVALALPGVTIADCTSYSVFAIGSAASPAVGDHPLQVVVAVDGIAAAATPPSTDTIGAASTPATSAVGASIVLIVATAIAFVGGLRFLSRRALRD